MKNLLPYLIIAIAGFAIVLAINYTQPGETPEQNPSPQEIADYFSERLQSPVIERIGQPIHGFEPFMFMESFPGLAAEDFEGVEANDGTYEAILGEVVYSPTKSNVITSAAFAITNRGMETLMNNIAGRLGIQLVDKNSVDNLISMLV